MLYVIKCTISSCSVLFSLPLLLLLFLKRCHRGADRSCDTRKDLVHQAAGCSRGSSHQMISFLGALSMSPLDVTAKLEKAVTFEIDWLNENSNKKKFFPRTPSEKYIEGWRFVKPAICIPLLGWMWKAGRRILLRFNPIAHGPLSIQSLGFKT